MDDHALEAMLGFPLFTDSEERLGWLMNLNAVRLEYSMLEQYTYVSPHELCYVRAWHIDALFNETGHFFFTHCFVCRSAYI